MVCEQILEITFLNEPEFNKKVPDFDEKDPKKVETLCI